MKAVWFNECGDANTVLQYGEMPTPVPGAGEVLVRLHASAVNPSDVKKRAGAQPPGFVDDYVIPHSDGAGVIEAVGAGVSAERIGSHAFVYQAQYQRHQGTCAEYVVVPAMLAQPLPDNVDFVIGACVGIPMMTAHRCVFADGDVAGKNILVTGASGRVGFYASQWAATSGANVIATAGSAERIEQARRSGVENVLDYHDENLLEQIMDLTDGAGIDRVVDVEFGMNIETNSKLLKTGGVVATYSSSKNMNPSIPFYPLMFNNITLQLVLVYNMPEPAKQQAADDVFNALGNNTLVHRIAENYPLQETAMAHIAIEGGNLDGCVVIDID